MCDMYLIYCNGHEPCCRTLPRPVAGPGSISRRGWCRAEMRERGMHRMISDVSSSSSFFHSILIYRRFLFLFEFLPNDSVIQPDSTSQENRHTTQVGVFFWPRWLRCLRTQFRGSTSRRVQAEPLWRQSQGRSNVSWCCNGLFPC